MALTYQWERCNAGGGACVFLPGQTNPTYLITAGDVGSTIRVIVSDGLTTATSQQTAVIGSIPPTPSRYVWTVGDPTWPYNQAILGGASTPGWAYAFPNGVTATASSGFVRMSVQDGNALIPARVYWDDSAFPTLMTSVSGSYGQPGTSGPCRTFVARVNQNDPPLGGIVNSSQGSLVRWGGGDNNPLFGPHPNIHPKQGETWFYGYAMATNPGYKPHGWDGSDLVFGDWNSFGLDMHSSIGTLGPVMPVVGTIAPNTGVNVGPNGSIWWRCQGQSFSHIMPPRLEMDITGGLNNASADDSAHTCIRTQGPAFTAGQVYKVIYEIKWDAFKNGYFRWWVNSGSGYIQYADLHGLCTLWRDSAGNPDGNTYPQLLNYRKLDNTIPDALMYYAGYIQGGTFSDVVIP